MAEQPEKAEREPRSGSTRNKVVGGAALLLGAAGLFAYIVGIKRRHRLDAEREIATAPSRGGTHAWTDATARHETGEAESEPEQREEA